MEYLIILLSIPLLRALLFGAGNIYFFQNQFFSFQKLVGDGISSVFVYTLFSPSSTPFIRKEIYETKQVDSRIQVSDQSVFILCQCANLHVKRTWKRSCSNLCEYNWPFYIIWYSLLMSCCRLESWSWWNILSSQRCCWRWKLGSERRTDVVKCWFYTVPVWGLFAR